MTNYNKYQNYTDPELAEMVAGYITEQIIPYIDKHITANNMKYQLTFKKYRCIIDYVLTFDGHGNLSDIFEFTIHKIGRDNNEQPINQPDNQKSYNNEPCAV